MSSYLTSNQILAVTGALANHFQTFTSGVLYRNVTINREPLKTFTTTGLDVLAGYNNYSQESNFTYTPQYETFPAIVIYQKEQTIKEFSEMRSSINVGKVFIKVEKDAADYINGAKVESVVLDNKLFNVITSEGVQNYLGLKYYKFGLQITN